jgi:tripartite-type tricarboxylate transporter receptor subunit TctC
VNLPLHIAPLISSLGRGDAGPKGMDPAIVQKLHDAFKKASEDPTVKALYKQLDIDYRYASGEQFKASMQG